MQHRIKLIIAALLMLATSGCALVYTTQDKFIFPNAAEGPMDRPTPPGAIQHWLETSDGERVESWLFLPEGASAETPVSAVIFFHGNSDFIENKLEYPEFYVPRGFACLMVEYRGYRRSSGNPSEEALVADAVAFHDWLGARPDIDVSRIAAHGHSMGAAIAAGLASKRELAALVLVSPFKSMPAQFSRYWIPSVLSREAFDNRTAIAAYAGPVLIIHGEADDIVPLGHGAALAEIAGARGTFITYPGVDHDVPWDWHQFGQDLMAFYQSAGLVE